MTERFEPTARAVAQVNGLSGYAFALIEHPIANNDDDALRAKAKSALRTIVELLTTRDR